MVDLKEAAGPYKAGEQLIPLAESPGPTYAPDFREMAHIIRNGEKANLLVTPRSDHAGKASACGMLS
jgi:hypothetical protein